MKPEKVSESPSTSNKVQVVHGLLGDYQLLDTTPNQGATMAPEVDEMWRDSIAVAVLQSYIAQKAIVISPFNPDRTVMERWCKYSYEWADCLMAARGTK